MATTYRFLPWARRGLAAALPEPAPASPPGATPAMPIRAEVAVRVVVSGGVGDVTTRALLHGPGDVIGLDPAQVVRMYPLPGTSNAEPAYLACVDFDAPELPWLFTPLGVPGTQHLPPWLVLVVVEHRDGVSVEPPASGPLPRLRIANGAAGELPDLADSWAWAHAQLLDSDAGAGTPAAIAAALTSAPDRNVSRLMCPRRLVPGRRWIAAVVPAFNVGVMRGLGVDPPANVAVGPAWAAPDSIILPIYHHWEFQTGPEGDFESLARRIRPHKASAKVGVVPMFVGDAAPPLRLPADLAQVLDMDGALRAPANSDGRLDQVPDPLVDGLQEITRTLADAADGVIDGQELEDSDRQPVGPPVLASAHVRRWKVKADDADWFREVNLDPRARVAGGLGAEVVRENQEDIVNVAWQQVGDVLAAEAALQRAALTTWAASAFHRRHMAPMTDSRLMGLVAPMAARTPVGGHSMTAAVHASSMPDAVLDAGLRRALAPAGRAVQRAARRVGVATPQLRAGLVATLAAGTEAVDATRFSRPALEGVAEADLRGTRDLGALGLNFQVAPEAIERLADRAADLSRDAEPPLAQRVAMRADLGSVGILSQAHVDAARRLSADAAAAVRTAVAAGAEVEVRTLSATSTAALVDGIAVLSAEGSATGPGVALLVEGPLVDPVNGALGIGEVLRLDVLDIDRGGTLVMRTAAGAANIPIATLDPNLSAADLTATLSRLPQGALRRADPGAGRVPGRAAAAGIPTIALAAMSPAAAPAGPLAAAVRIDPIRVDPALAAGPPGSPLGAVTRGLGRGVGGMLQPGGRATGPGVGRTAGVAGLTPIGPGVGVVATPTPVVAPPAVAPVRPVGPLAPTYVVPPLIRDPGTIARLQVALTDQLAVTVLAVAEPVARLVPYDLAGSMSTVRERTLPVKAQALRRDALVALGGRVVGQWALPHEHAVDGWWATHQVDRIMAYPTFPVAAYEYLARYDRTRFCPGVDEIPPESVTLLETNPRFIASFMVGLNHETNRELLWRGYPTDSRGTPFRHFWARLDGKSDIEPIHGWRTGTLAGQTTDPKGNLVLLLRGDLLRRYPNTIVLAMRATAEDKPSRAPADLVHPIFAGRFDPDVSFFGFPLQDTDLTRDKGYFFALMEPVTEPRFGLDDTATRSVPAPSTWSGVGWGDTPVPPGGHLTAAALAALSVAPAPAAADGVAEALFQRPFALYVHAKHITAPLPVQK